MYMGGIPDERVKVANLEPNVATDVTPMDLSHSRPVSGSVRELSQ